MIGSTSRVKNPNPALEGYRVDIQVIESFSSWPTCSVRPESAFALSECRFYASGFVGINLMCSRSVVCLLHGIVFCALYISAYMY